MKKNNNMEIKFNGKEYIEYLKYQESIKKVWTKQDKGIIGALIGLTILIIPMLIMISMLAPHPPTQPFFTWEVIGKIFVLSIPLAWILHGFGFLLVRR